MESFSHLIKVILLLSVLTGSQNVFGLPSSSPSPVFQKTKEVQHIDVNQRPQVQPGIIVAEDERDYYNVVNENTRPTEQITRQELKPQVLPAIYPGPAQPSSDILPPSENGPDQDFFVNVKTKPTEVSTSNLKTKRDNSDGDDLNAKAQEQMARFLIPGLNLNWGACCCLWYIYTCLGGEISSNTESSLDCPRSSPIAPILLDCGLKECSEDSECFSERKCCRYACAFICVDPVTQSSSKIGSNQYDSKDPGQNSLELTPLISTIVGNQGNNNNNNNYEKPGSCYRPNNNYYVGSGYNNNGYRNDYNNNFGRVKRQTTFGSSSYTPYSDNKFGYPGNNNNNGGWQGSGGYYPPGNNAGGWQGGNGIGSGYCYRDRDCAGNMKCCSRQCRTPAFFG